MVFYSQALKKYLAESLKMLTTIHASYSSFQDGMLKESKKLPALLEPDLELYDSTLCTHLGVTRMNNKHCPSVRIIRTSTLWSPCYAIPNLRGSS